MKLDNRLQGLFIVAIIIATNGQSTALGQQISTPTSEPAGKTNTASDEISASSDARLWLGFLKLAVKPNWEITLADVEKAFPHEKISPVAPNFAAYHIGNTGSYTEFNPQGSYDEHPGRSDRAISLSFNNKKRAWCPSRQKLAGDIVQLARWGQPTYSPTTTITSGPNKGRTSSYISFIREQREMLTVVYMSDCPLAANLQVNPPPPPEPIVAPRRIQF
ncbi:hypothetical protein [Dyella mobilis]|uniref:Uncharacterized protein n=1 Tax=Dyella mobilis TaxID=1849582 RepID=A0ABS2KFN6_9GAMM|nr:hypothetical protein [Dyella mobilis]MBM7129971.1 hypothetical protein [Dyella mobilis]GLQ97765.1 hypothetical protein GCM10007863_21850 [Dyella mobilis]